MNLINRYRSKSLYALLFITVFLFSSCKKDKFGNYTEEVDLAYLIPETEIDQEEAQIWLKQLTDSVQSSFYFPDSFQREFLQKQLALFYQQSNFEPVWYSATTVLPHTQSLMGYLKNADSEGLNKDAYSLAHIDSIQNVLLGSNGSYDLPNLAKLEVFTTAMALTYLNHVHRGRVKPDEIQNDDNVWVEDVKAVYAVNLLHEAIKKQSFDELIAHTEPQYELYTKLKTARQQYEKIVQEGGWEKISLENIDYKLKIDSNQRHEFIPTIRNILAKTGDFEGNSTDTSQVYDQELRKAVINYQKRHTLETDGVIGLNVLRELAVPAQDRLQQIELNMERMRWLKDSLGDSYFVVNVPAYWVRLYDKGERNFECKVMVGQSYHPTPLFSDVMEYIVLSPKWHVPVSISNNEMLPKLRRNPSYFTRNNFTIYQRTSDGVQAVNPHSVNWSAVRSMGNYSVVQGSGAGNALGRVKFIFPNSNNVYMHDTPSTQFDKANRALSHGCIRLEKPEALANYLLNQHDEKWTEDKVHEAMYSGNTQQVNLKRKWNVHLVYWTTWVDDEGKVHFAKDIYQYDKKQKEVLARRDEILKSWMKARTKEFERLKQKKQAELLAVLD